MFCVDGAGYTQGVLSPSLEENNKMQNEPEPEQAPKIDEKKRKGKLTKAQRMKKIEKINKYAEQLMNNINYKKNP